MHKRAFQGLKRSFLHETSQVFASGLPPPILYFDNMVGEDLRMHKRAFHKLVLLSKYGGGRPETCINVRFRA